MNKTMRCHEIVTLVAQYLFDWFDEDDNCQDINEIIKSIELYGITLSEPCDALVINAVRHLKDVVNPWNNDTLPDILQDVGFIKKESETYSNYAVPLDGIPYLVMRKK